MIIFYSLASVNMRDSDLTKLRRARARVTKRIDQLEPMLAGYRAKLADLEARIHDLAPELNMPPRRYNPNPHFARGELPRLAIKIMREAGVPLSTREIAVRALAMKGVTLPDRRAMKLTRLRLQQTFCTMAKRGLVAKIGEGKAGKRVIKRSRPSRTTIFLWTNRRSTEMLSFQRIGTPHIGDSLAISTKYGSLGDWPLRHLECSGIYLVLDKPKATGTNRGPLGDPQKRYPPAER